MRKKWGSRSLRRGSRKDLPSMRRWWGRREPSGTSQESPMPIKHFRAKISSHISWPSVFGLLSSASMPRPSPSFRLLTSALLGLASAGACGAAMPNSDKTDGTTLGPGAGSEAEQLAKKSKEENGGDGKPNCPNGALEDPHRG